MAIREINLVPLDILHRQKVWRHIVFWSAWLVLSMTIIALVYGYQIIRVISPLQPATSIEEMYTHLGATFEEIDQTRTEIERLRVQEAFLKSITRNQPLSLTLLRIIHRINLQTWLTALAVKAGEEKEEGLLMTLSGFSKSNDTLGIFLTALSEEPLFHAVVLKYAREVPTPRYLELNGEPVRAIQFQIRCKIPVPSL
ncbi:MAG: PilN domain-containing protein [Desulfobacteraceae bacterium]|nr:PilN domain-containing protein [Desulfobacteraceae bacterium]